MSDPNNDVLTAVPLGADDDDESTNGSADPYAALAAQQPPSSADAYAAMLGAQYDPNAVARQLSNQSVLGQLISSTGNKAVMPVGEMLSDQAQTQLGGLARTKQAMAQLQAEQQERQAELGAQTGYQQAELQQRRDALTQQAREDDLNRQNQQQMRLLMLNGERAQQGLPPLTMGAGGNISASAAPTTPSLASSVPPTGDAYLTTLDPAERSLVQRAAAGGIQISPAMMRSPAGKRLMSDVTQYDPDFDQGDYNARYKMHQAFTSGTQGQTLNSINMALGHLGQLYGNIGNVASTSFPALNAAMNWGKKETGGAGPTQWDATAQTVATEVPKALRGSGMAEADVDRFMNVLSMNGSQAQKQASIRQMAQLLQSRENAMRDQYTATMGQRHAPATFLTPAALADLDTINGQPSDASSAPAASMPGLSRTRAALGVGASAGAASNQGTANFIVGKQYRDARGNVATYRGNGQWQ